MLKAERVENLKLETPKLEVYKVNIELRLSQFEKLSAHNHNFFL